MVEQRNDMQLAEILSDLVSLRAGVCDPTAALALVSAHRTSTSSTSATTTATSPAGKNEEDDVDLTRARELVELHYNVRERCRTGELKRGLEEARREVERVLGGGV